MWRFLRISSGSVSCVVLGHLSRVSWNFGEGQKLGDMERRQIRTLREILLKPQGLLSAICKSNMPAESPKVPLF